MRLVLGLIAGLALLPHTGVAQSEQALSETAVAQLQSAAFLLERANSARDRVRALTETVAAYETALDAIRDGLRAATIQETRLSLQLDAKRDRIERLVSVLQAIGKAPEPSLLLHPSGPTGTARAGMILADVTPALQKEAEALARELSALSEARQLRQQTLEHLQTGLVGVQLARTELSITSHFEPHGSTQEVFRRPRANRPSVGFDRNAGTICRGSQYNPQKRCIRGSSRCNRAKGDFGFACSGRNPTPF